MDVRYPAGEMPVLHNLIAAYRKVDTVNKQDHLLHVIFSYTFQMASICDNYADAIGCLYRLYHNDSWIPAKTIMYVVTGHMMNMARIEDIIHVRGPYTYQGATVSINVRECMDRRTIFSDLQYGRMQDKECNLD